MLILKVNVQVWLSYMKEEDDHYTTDERKEYGAEERYSSEPPKAHLTGAFVICSKVWWPRVVSFSL